MPIVKTGTGIDKPKKKREEKEEKPSKASEEVAIQGALRSGDPTAIAAAQKRLRERMGVEEVEDIPQEQLTVKQSQETQADIAKFGGEIPTAQNIPVGSFEAGRERIGGKILPSVPGVASGIRFAESNVAAESIGRLKGIGKFEDVSPDIQTKLNLNELDLQTIKEGKANTSFFGRLVEAIPISRIRVGGISVAAFLPGTPSKKVQELRESMNKLVQDAQDNVGFASSNPSTRLQYINLNRDILEQVDKLESRIKLLTIQSSELQSNPDAIDDIMKEITSNKRKLVETFSLI